MGYSLDLASLSIERYRDLLKSKNLLPGRRILGQDIEVAFQKIASAGIENVLQLKKALSTPKSIASFATESDLSQEYLTVLKREIGSLEQKPVPLTSFPDIDGLLISALNARDIKSSKDYWEATMNSDDELYCLCDLVRINGIGPVAAKAFYEAGYTSVSAVATAGAVEMLQRITEVNETKHYFKAKLGLKDMQFCIDSAMVLC